VELPEREALRVNIEGRALEKSGRIDEAVALFEYGVAGGTDTPFTYTRLRILYRRLKRPEDVDRRMRFEATCGYNTDMASTGVRELKDNLSRYIRRVEAGERIAVTAHGRVVAELVPPQASRQPHRSRWDELLAAGTLRAPLEAGDPFEDWPDIRLPRGTAAALIDADRGEA